MVANISAFEQWFAKNIQLKQISPDFVKSFEDIDNTVGGWSGPELMATLNTAVSYLDDGEEYLEIGTFCGKSLAGTLRNNMVRAQVIDNFWDGRKVENEWNETVDRFQIRDRVTLHKEYTEKWSGDMPTIGVFFYDGNHDSGHSYEGLKKFESYLSDRAIIVVDDYMIHGGTMQTPFPGHVLDKQYPVRTDVNRLLAEDSRYRMIGVTTWGQQQAFMAFNR